VVCVVSCGAGQRGWFHEAEGAARPLLSWLRALAAKKRFARRGL